MAEGIKKLDFGCGPKASHRADFIGLDRFELPGVDVVCNVDSNPLPFADESFELIFASHSLEHVGDLNSVMRELWRVALPGCQLCILAPYSETSLNRANPYHIHDFNEHTPRFWTAEARTLIPAREYVLPPSGDHWGLMQSDNSQASFDWRCCRMEFFYFSGLRYLPKWRLRQLRKRSLNVCHSVLYHLFAAKRGIMERPDEFPLYMPPEILPLRYNWMQLRAMQFVGRAVPESLRQRVRQFLEMP